MRITCSNKEYMPTVKGINSRQVKNIARHTKRAMDSLDKKTGFMSTPIKYTIFGLAIPIPFAFAFGFIAGLGVAIYKKITGKNENKKLNKP